MDVTGTTNVTPDSGTTDKPMTSLLDGGWAAGSGDSGKPDLSKEGQPDRATLTPEQKAAAEAQAKTDADAKAKAQTDASKVIPEKYDAKLPEGVALDQVALDAVSPVLKDLGVTQEGFQKIVDAYAPVMQKTVESAVKQASDASAQAFEQETTKWAEETKKTYGPKLQEKLVASAKAMMKVFDGNQAEEKQFRDLLAASGLGNHPLAVKFFSYYGEKVSEGKMPVGSNITTNDGKNPAEIMYPEMAKQ